MTQIDICMKRQAILYITPKTNESTAAFINTYRRIAAIKQSGWKVIPFYHTPGQFIRDCGSILGKSKKIDGIMIRVDGSGREDKFTLLKLLFPGIRIYWELHGFPEESTTDQTTLWQGLTYRKQRLKRRLLSFFVDTIVCISKELETFAKTQMLVRHSYVIPNFVVPAEYRFTKNKRNTTLDTLATRFYVCWGGGADLRWQALDIIEQTARYIHKIDPSILFVVVGSNTWHTPTWHNNTFYLSHLPRKNMLQLIERAAICLALYHTPKAVPFYFAPLKILDYMALHKAIIATDHPPIRQYITHEINGLLTNNSPADIAKKILLLKKRPSYAERLGSQASQTVMNRFSITQAGKLYTAVLDRLAGK